MQVAKPNQEIKVVFKKTQTNPNVSMEENPHTNQSLIFVHEISSIEENEAGYASNSHNVMPLNQMVEMYSALDQNPSESSLKLLNEKDTKILEAMKHGVDHIITQMRENGYENGFAQKFILSEKTLIGTKYAATENQASYIEHVRSTLDNFIPVLEEADSVEYKNLSKQIEVYGAIYNEITPQKKQEEEMVEDYTENTIEQSSKKVAQHILDLTPGQSCIIPFGDSKCCQFIKDSNNLSFELRLYDSKGVGDIIPANNKIKRNAYMNMDSYPSSMFEVAGEDILFSIFSNPKLSTIDIMKKFSRYYQNKEIYRWNASSEKMTPADSPNIPVEWHLLKEVISRNTDIDLDLEYGKQKPAYKQYKFYVRFITLISHFNLLKATNQLADEKNQEELFLMTEEVQSSIKDSRFSNNLQLTLQATCIDLLNRLGRSNPNIDISLSPALLTQENVINDVMNVIEEADTLPQNAINNHEIEAPDILGRGYQLTNVELAEDYNNISTFFEGLLHNVEIAEQKFGHRGALSNSEIEQLEQMLIQIENEIAMIPLDKSIFATKLAPAEIKELYIKIKEKMELYSKLVVLARNNSVSSMVANNRITALHLTYIQLFQISHPKLAEFGIDISLFEFIIKNCPDRRDITKFESEYSKKILDYVKTLNESKIILNKDLSDQSGLKDTKAIIASIIRPKTKVTNNLQQLNQESIDISELNDEAKILYCFYFSNDLQEFKSKLSPESKLNDEESTLINALYRLRDAGITYNASLSSYLEYPEPPKEEHISYEYNGQKLLCPIKSKDGCDHSKIQVNSEQDFIVSHFGYFYTRKFGVDENFDFSYKQDTQNEDVHKYFKELDKLAETDKMVDSSKITELRDKMFFGQSKLNSGARTIEILETLNLNDLRKNKGNLDWYIRNFNSLFFQAKQGSEFRYIDDVIAKDNIVSFINIFNLKNKEILGKLDLTDSTDINIMLFIVELSHRVREIEQEYFPAKNHKVSIHEKYIKELEDYFSNKLDPKYNSIKNQVKLMKLSQLLFTDFSKQTVTSKNIIKQILQLRKEMQGVTDYNGLPDPSFYSPRLLRKIYAIEKYITPEIGFDVCRDLYASYNTGNFELTHEGNNTVWRYGNCDIDLLSGQVFQNGQLQTPQKLYSLEQVKNQEIKKLFKSAKIEKLHIILTGNSLVIYDLQSKAKYEALNSPDADITMTSTSNKKYKLKTSIPGTYIPKVILEDYTMWESTTLATEINIIPNFSGLPELKYEDHKIYKEAPDKQFLVSSKNHETKLKVFANFDQIEEIMVWENESGGIKAELSRYTYNEKPLSFSLKQTSDNQYLWEYDQDKNYIISNPEKSHPLSNVAIFCKSSDNQYKLIVPSYKHFAKNESLSKHLPKNKEISYQDNFIGSDSFYELDVTLNREKQILDVAGKDPEQLLTFVHLFLSVHDYENAYKCIKAMNTAVKTLSKYGEEVIKDIMKLESQIPNAIAVKLHIAIFAKQLGFERLINTSNLSTIVKSYSHEKTVAQLKLSNVDLHSIVAPKSLAGETFKWQQTEFSSSSLQSQLKENIIKAHDFYRYDPKLLDNITDIHIIKFLPKNHDLKKEFLNNMKILLSYNSAIINKEDNPLSEPEMMKLMYNVEHSDQFKYNPLKNFYQFCYYSRFVVARIEAGKIAEDHHAKFEELLAKAEEKIIDIPADDSFGLSEQEKSLFQGQNKTYGDYLSFVLIKKMISTAPNKDTYEKYTATMVKQNAPDDDIKFDTISEADTDANFDHEIDLSHADTTCTNYQNSRNSLNDNIIEQQPCIEKVNNRHIEIPEIDSNFTSPVANSVEKYNLELNHAKERRSLAKSILKQAIEAEIVNFTNELMEEQLLLTKQLDPICKSLNQDKARLIELAQDSAEWTEFVGEQREETHIDLGKLHKIILQFLNIKERINALNAINGIHGEVEYCGDKYSLETQENKNRLFIKIKIDSSMIALDEKKQTLENRIEDLVYRINYDKISKWKFEQLSIPDLKDLVRAASDDKKWSDMCQYLHSINKTLDAEKFSEIRVKCIDLMLAQTELNHFNRISEDIQENNSTDKLISNITAKRQHNIDYKDDIFILYFEYVSGFELSDKQVEVIRKIISALKKGDGGFLAQITMGGGKTNVIASMIAVLAPFFNLCTIFANDTSQHATATGTISEQQKKRYNQNIILIDFAYEDLSDPIFLDEIMRRFDYAFVSGAAISMDSTILDFLNLKLRDVLYKDTANSAILAEKLSKILHHITNKTSLVFDEVDTNASSKKVTRIAIGNNRKLSQYEINVVTNIYKEIIALDVNSQIPFYNNEQTKVSVEEHYPAIQQQLAHRLYEKYEDKITAAKLSKQEFITWSTEAEFSEEAQELYLKVTLMVDHEFRNQISLIRNCLVRSLPNTLSLRNRQDFGINLHATSKEKQFQQIVPYFKGEISSEGTKFADPYETQMLTFQAFLDKNVPIPKELVISFAKQMKELISGVSPDSGVQGEAIANNINKIFRDTVGEDLNQFMLVLNGGNAEAFEELCNRACDRVNNSPLSRITLAEYVAVNHISMNMEFLVQKATRKVNMGKVAIGYTGTPSNYKTLNPILSENYNFEKDSSGNIMYEMLEREETKTITVTCADGTFKTVTDRIKVNLQQNHGKMRAFIDCGGFARNILNRDVAQSIRKIIIDESPNDFDGVAFFDQEKNVWKILKIVEDKSYTIDSTSRENIEKIGLNPDKIFVFYDQSHTIGTDFKLPPETIAELSIDPSNSIDAILQAVLRLRQFLKNQHISIVTSGASDNLKEIFEKAIAAQAQELAEETYYARLDMLENIYITEVDKLIVEAKTYEEKKAIFQKYKELLIKTESVSAFEKYGTLGEMMNPQEGLAKKYQYLTETLDADGNIKFKDLYDRTKEELQTFYNRYISSSQEAPNPEYSFLPKQVPTNVIKTGEQAQQKEQQNQNVQQNQNMQQRQQKIPVKTGLWKDQQPSKAHTTLRIPETGIIEAEGPGIAFEFNNLFEIFPDAEDYKQLYDNELFLSKHYLKMFDAEEKPQSIFDERLLRKSYQVLVLKQENTDIYKTIIISSEEFEKFYESCFTRQSNKISIDGQNFDFFLFSKSAGLIYPQQEKMNVHLVKAAAKINLFSGSLITGNVDKRMLLRLLIIVADHSKKLALIQWIKNRLYNDEKQEMIVEAFDGQVAKFMEDISAEDLAMVGKEVDVLNNLPTALYKLLEDGEQINLLVPEKVQHLGEKQINKLENGNLINAVPADKLASLTPYALRRVKPETIILALQNKQLATEKLIYLLHEQLDYVMKHDEILFSDALKTGSIPGQYITNIRKNNLIESIPENQYQFLTAKNLEAITDSNLLTKIILHKNTPPGALSDIKDKGTIQMIIYAGYEAKLYKSQIERLKLSDRYFMIMQGKLNIYWANAKQKEIKNIYSQWVEDTDPIALDKLLTISHLDRLDNDFIINNIKHKVFEDYAKASININLIKLLLQQHPATVSYEQFKLLGSDHKAYIENEKIFNLLTFVDKIDDSNIIGSIYTKYSISKLSATQINYLTPSDISKEIININSTEALPENLKSYWETSKNQEVILSVMAQNPDLMSDAHWQELIAHSSPEAIAEKIPNVESENKMIELYQSKNATDKLKSFVKFRFKLGDVEERKINAYTKEPILYYDTTNLSLHATLLKQDFKFTPEESNSNDYQYICKNITYISNLYHSKAELTDAQWMILCANSEQNLNNDYTHLAKYLQSKTKESKTFEELDKIKWVFDKFQTSRRTLSKEYYNKLSNLKLKDKHFSQSKQENASATFASNNWLALLGYNRIYSDSLENDSPSTKAYKVLGSKPIPIAPDSTANVKNIVRVVNILISLVTGLVIVKPLTIALTLLMVKLAEVFTLQETDTTGTKIAKILGKIFVFAPIFIIAASLSVVTTIFSPGSPISNLHNINTKLSYRTVQIMIWIARAMKIGIQVTAIIMCAAALMMTGQGVTILVIKSVIDFPFVMAFKSSVLHGVLAVSTIHSMALAALIIYIVNASRALVRYIIEKYSERKAMLDKWNKWRNSAPIAWAINMDIENNIQNLLQTLRSLKSISLKQQYLREALKQYDSDDEYLQIISAIEADADLTEIINRKLKGVLHRDHSKGLGKYVYKLVEIFC